MRCLVWLVLALLFSCVTPLQYVNTTFDWPSAPCEKHLVYTPCYGDLQCARLQLPFDYWNSTTNATLCLALVRSPAGVEVSDPRYGGAVVHHAGGPGRSGVEYMRKGSHGMRMKLEFEPPKQRTIEEVREFINSAKYFDIIGFDPRGVRYTTPVLPGLPEPRHDAGWAGNFAEREILGSSDDALNRLWAFEKVYSGSASLPCPDGEDDLRPYLSATYTARDLLEIAERHGEWREQQAELELQEVENWMAPSDPLGTCAWPKEVPEAARYDVGAEQLLFQTGSYGSIVGLEFATMYPDRVGKMLLDGVSEAFHHRHGMRPPEAAEAENTMRFFYEECARVGHPNCALASGEGHSSPASVEERVNNILLGLRANPLPVIGRDPAIVTYSHVRGELLMALYSPIASFKRLAGALMGIETGDGRPFLELFGSDDRDRYQYGDTTLKVASSGESWRAIECTDIDDHSNMTKAQLDEYWQYLNTLTPTLGPFAAGGRIACIHYSIKSVHRFTGDYGGNTSSPILFIGNTADPVSPLSSARGMSRLFPGSVVLQQDSAGHCSGSSPSVCTTEVIKRYFQSGRLPAKVCPVDKLPFDESSPSDW